MYNGKYRFIEYKNGNNYIDDSLKTRFKKLVSFNNQLKEFKKRKARKERAIIKRKSVYDDAVNLYNIILSIYFNDYNNATNEEKKGKDEKHDPSNLLLKGSKFIYLNEKEEEKSKSLPEETIDERVNLRRQKEDLSFHHSKVMKINLTCHH